MLRRTSRAGMAVAPVPPRLIADCHRDDSRRALPGRYQERGASATLVRNRPCGAPSAECARRKQAALFCTREEWSVWCFRWEAPRQSSVRLCGAVVGWDRGSHDSSA